MRISGKFSNRKIGKQIALILLLAAFIPTALITQGNRIKSRLLSMTYKMSCKQ